MNETIKSYFDNLSVEEVENFIKNELRPYVKERKAEEKSAIVNDVKERMEVGDVVLARYKTFEITGTVVSMRDKSFTMLTDEVTTDDGDPKKITRGYEFVIEFVVKNEELDEETEMEDEDLDEAVI